MNHSEYLDKAADYLNGTQSPEERAGFEIYLQTNPIAHQELLNLEALREMLASQIHEETDTAWVAMRTRLHSEYVPISFLALWRRWRMRLSLLTAITVAVIEAMLLINAPVYRSISVDGNIRQIHVVFSPDAQQRQVRELLDHVLAQISAGPGPSGEYTLSLPAEEMDTALSTLRAAPIVQDAYQVNVQP